MKKNIQLVKEESAKLYQEIIDNGYSREIAKTISEELSNKGGLTPLEFVWKLQTWQIL